MIGSYTEKITASIKGEIILLIMVLIVLFCDPTNIIHNYYKKTGVYDRENESYLYLKFPPTSITDMMPSLIALHVFYLVIFLY